MKYCNYTEKKNDLKVYFITSTDNLRLNVLILNSNETPWNASGCRLNQLTKWRWVGESMNLCIDLYVIDLTDRSSWKMQ